MGKIIRKVLVKKKRHISTRLISCNGASAQCVRITVLLSFLHKHFLGNPKHSVSFILMGMVFLTVLLSRPRTLYYYVVYVSTYGKSVVCGVEQRLLQIQDAGVWSQVEHIQTPVVSHLAHQAVVQTILGRKRNSDKHGEVVRSSFNDII